MIRLMMMLLDHELLLLIRFYLDFVVQSGGGQYRQGGVRLQHVDNPVLVARPQSHDCFSFLS